MKQNKYEIRFGGVTHHAVYIMADDVECAIEIACENNNKKSQKKYSKSDVALAIKTNKIPLSDAAPQFTKSAPHSVHISINYLESQISQIEEYGKLLLQPDFQRAHVWNKDQQIKFMEFLLRGGKSGRDIYFNSPEWRVGFDAPDMVLVDGLQRITAVRLFMSGDLKVFGKYTVYDFEYVSNINLIFHTNNLESESEVLKWYLEMNSGGTQHTEAELDKVRDMLNDVK